jgi:hypothetical protein
MTDQPRDWDKELADIDRVIEKTGGRPGGQAGGTPALPAPPGGAPARVPVAATPEAPRRSVAVTWFWVVLSVVLAAALPLWPYGKQCGLQFFFYLGAIVLAFLAGAAGAVSSWATRSGLAHILSLLVVLWSGAMGAREVLPRIGYAAQTKTWLCPSAPEPAPTGTPAPGGTGSPSESPSPSVSP